MPEGVVVTEQQFINLFKHLLRLYVEAHELDTAQMCKVTKKEFVEWCVANEHPICEEDAATIPEALGVPSAALEFVWGVFQDAYAACDVLGPIWDTLVLSGRPPAMHQPASFLLSVTVLFADRRVLQMQAMTPWNPRKPITDGFLCALLKSQMVSLANTIGARGLDALYTEYSQSVDERLGASQEPKKLILPGEGAPPKDGG